MYVNLPLFPPKMAKNRKERDFGKNAAATSTAAARQSSECDSQLKRMRAGARIWAVGPAGGELVVEGVAVHFCTKFALADGMHCNFRPSENSATSPTALATLSLALACHALARRAQWLLIYFCKNKESERQFFVYLAILIYMLICSLSCQHLTF